MPLHRFDAPGTILHGGGARNSLPDLLERFDARRVLVVTDPGVVALGVAEEIETILSGAGVSSARFTDVQPDPTDRNVEAGVAALRDAEADAIIALGGGSPIDTAKVIGVREANPGPLSDYQGLHRIRRPGLPVIAIPTTAGTGSEATKVAVITDTERDVKMMMLAFPLLPSAAVVDFELTLTMPPGLTAAVGVDTFTHGLEAYVSRKANAQVDPIALSCVRLTARHLEQAWREGGNRTAREAMMLAATQGGMAFSNSSVCLVHGMSRPLGAIFHIPHGLSNAILLPAVTRFSISAAPARYADVARTIGAATPEDGEASASAKLADWLAALNQRLELPRLRECRGVTRERLEANLRKMAADALASGSPANNPRVPTPEQIVALYEEAW